VSGHAPAAAASEPTLLPVPTDEAREAAAKLAQDVYRSDYASAKSAAGKQALAKRILDDALKVRNDATQRYVLLFLARDVAIAGQDEKAAFQAIGELGRTYSIDPWAMKAEAMQHLAKGSHPPAAHRELAGRALALAEEAIEADKFSVADAMAKLALADAGKVRDKELVQRSRALVKEGQETATAFAAIEEASIILRENPADPAANLAVGKYLCFTKGGWPKGLLHLTKSNDAGLKSLADDERRNTPPWEPAPGVVPPDPPPASVALRLADGGWEAGQTVLGKQHDRILLHAGYWYNQSFGSDIASLVATKISTRLEQIEKIRRQYPAPPLAIAPFDASEAREHQRRWADYLGVPVVMANSMGMKLVLVPPGEFEMGSNEEEIDFCRRIGENRNESKYYFIGLQGEGPRHHIRMIKPYYLGMFEVTQGEFEALLRFNPSAYAHNGTRKNAVAGTETRLFPVESVTWHECVTLCRKLGDLPAERASGRGYRMPTEAEWEYACRAGSATLWPYGNEEPTKPPYFSAVGHAVGRTESNPWRLYDMLGSVAEWCADYWDPQYYRNSPTVAPTGATIGATRVVRGVGFGPLFCRPAFRYNYMPDARRDYCGFRVLCFLSEPVTR
jgi:formylglycine-generating enzyme required for sulfatase activity